MRITLTRRQAEATAAALEARLAAGRDTQTAAAWLIICDALKIDKITEDIKK